MKKMIFLTGLLMLFCFTTLNAQDKQNMNNQQKTEMNSQQKMNMDDKKMSAAEVPDNVKAEFVKLYPNMDINNVKWMKEGKMYEARISDEGKGVGLHIDESGNFVKKETYIKMADLPKNAQEYLNSKYNGKKFGEIADVTDAHNMKYFEVETSGKVLHFDSSGKFIKATSEENEGLGE